MQFSQSSGCLPSRSPPQLPARLRCTVHRFAASNGYAKRVQFLHRPARHKFKLETWRFFLNCTVDPPQHRGRTHLFTLHQRPPSVFHAWCVLPAPRHRHCASQRPRPVLRAPRDTRRAPAWRQDCTLPRLPVFAVRAAGLAAALCQHCARSAQHASRPARATRNDVAGQRRPRRPIRSPTSAVPLRLTPSTSANRPQQRRVGAFVQHALQRRKQPHRPSDLAFRVRH